MTYFDIILTPIYFPLLYFMTMALGKKYYTKETKKYFKYGFLLKMSGAIFFGLIYQFYYGGGDTFNYYDHSSVIIKAFLDSPSLGFKLLFSQGEIDPTTFKYVSRLVWYQAPKEFLVAKIAAIFGLVSFNNFTVISLFFACFSFIGLWAMYLAWIDMYPKLKKEAAIAIFFIPSMFFWGSGIMKDTLCVAGLGLMFHSFYFGVIKRKNGLKNLLIGAFSIWLVGSLKAYILMAFLPAAALWVFQQY